MRLAALDCNFCQGDEPSTGNLFQEHKKELAGALAGLFCVLTVLGLVFGVDGEDLTDARNWAKQDWKEFVCTVEDAGIAYRGNCHTDVTLMMTDYFDFAECMGPHHMQGHTSEVREEWDATRPGLCARRGNDAYVASSEGQILGEGEAAGRRLGRYWHERIVCHNSYLPWAVLKVPNASGEGGITRCAYEFGATRPSITGDWSAATLLLRHLRRARGPDGGALCWVLKADDCVVALHDHRVLTKKERGERNLLRVHTFVCGALAVALGACVACWQCQDLGCCDSSGIGGHMPLPTDEPEILSGRVRQLAEAAAARLEETTPPPSGSSTLRLSGVERSHRTVEAVLPNGCQTRVPQNIASDFINGYW